MSQIAPNDRGTMLETLLMASAKSSDSRGCVLVAGSTLLRIELDEDQPRTRTVELPSDLGPLRSIRGATIDGERAYDRLADIPDRDRIDFVDVFRRGEFLDAVVDDARAAGVRAIWFQLDLENVDAAKRAEQFGMRVVWDRCTAIEHRRLDAV
jgi:hypothetical protein